MLIIPFRVKNPIKSFPWVTLSIVILNVVVYVFSTHDLRIREDVVKHYAFLLGVNSPLTFFSSVFLHADLFHIAGNMLFLWVFGPPVEDRLGKVSYSIVYFITGFAGALLQAVVDKLTGGHIRPCIGASGCIMGVVGAYWYLFAWSKVCVFYWIALVFRGVWEIAAIWVIGYFFVQDLFQGMLVSTLGVSGGVANFAHLGGAMIGALMCIVTGATRDTQRISEVKALQSDTADLSLMPLHALQTMLDEDPANPRLVRAIIPPALALHRQDAIDKAFEGAGVGLVESSPDLVAHYLVDLQGNPGMYQPVHLLRLAGHMEQSGEHAKALHIYKIVVDRHPMTNDAETAIYRMAQSYWRVFRDASRAQACLSELQRRFPDGSMSHFARALTREMDAPQA